HVVGSLERRIHVISGKSRAKADQGSHHSSSHHDERTARSGRLGRYCCFFHDRYVDDPLTVQCVRNSSLLLLLQVKLIVFLSYFLSTNQIMLSKILLVQSTRLFAIGFDSLSGCLEASI